MTDLEKSERWLGVSIRDACRTAAEALPGVQPEDLRPGIEALWLNLYQRRIRMHTSQIAAAKKKSQPKPQ